MKRRILRIALVLAMIALMVLGWIYWPLPRPKIVISKKTTYLTGPVNPDGTIDYRSVVEEILKKGVTPENNAAPLLLRAVGPRCIHEEEARPLVLEALGLADLPEEGEYFVPLGEHAESRGVSVSGGTDVDEVMEYRFLEEWLEENRGPLEMLLSATKRARLYVPLVSSGSIPGLMSPPCDLQWGMVKSADVALLCRSRVKLDAGDVRGAWDDALAVLRLGSLATQNWTMLSTILGDTLRIQACEGLGRVVKTGKLDDPGARSMISDLRSLPPVRSTAERYHISRLFQLASAMLLVTMPQEESSFPFPRRRATPPFDPNVMLEEYNVWYDRYDEALKKEDIGTQIEELREINLRLQLEVRAWKKSMDSAVGWLNYLLRSRARRRELASRSVARVFLERPPYWYHHADTIAADTRINLLITSLALAAFKADHGSYPDQLSDLVPAYLESIPADLFAGAPPRYVRKGDGYLLYSVGRNLKDGGGSEKEREDIVFQVE